MTQTQTTAPSPAPASKKTGLFTGPDGRNLALTFVLVSSLFLLWGFCNGMIDVMDKHFQEELHLSLSQSAWVQFAHYLGYFLMALPAGWLAGKLGYRGGIIAGLLMVAIGGFWFIPATQIAAFWAFLLGVCLIAAGLTFLETVANPYTLVLGPKQFAPTRINLAQSCNGIGWVLGPIAGAKFFYATNADGKSTGAETLWIPYAGVGIIVIILALVFLKAYIPDIKMPDDYKLDEKDTGTSTHENNTPLQKPRLSFFLIWCNISVLSLAIGMIASAIATIFTENEPRILLTFGASTALCLLAGTSTLLLKFKKLSPHSIWSHPHFSCATITQFFYVAAQSGIFAYFINYMTSQAPIHIDNQTASTLASLGFICFLVGRFTGAGLLRLFPAHKILGLYGLLNVLVCALIFLKLGWISTIGVFASYFFMSVMFPTIFALGTFGLGARSKKASAFIVMAIMGGAIMPKLMGHIADLTDISRGFIVPLACFLIVAAYGFSWKTLSHSTNTPGTSTP